MKTNKILIAFLVLLLVVIAGYVYIYKGHRDIAAEDVNFTVTSEAIFNEFQSSETSANLKYLDKTIMVSGNVSSVGATKQSIVLDEKLFATFLEAIPETLSPNSQITIKGRLIGYDSLLEEIKLDQCTIVK